MQSQRASTSRYRERNKAELRRKAQERMARHRALLKESEADFALYKDRARQYNARYRESHRSALAEREQDRRLDASIKNQHYENKNYAAWMRRHLKQARAARRSPAPAEELPEWPESDDPPENDEPEDDEDDGAEIPPPPPESASYDEHMNYFLDYLDPTIAADYVPKPGQKPFFQRGKTRWY
ncbi:hypothetical protein C8F04DRAFT_1275912 [Mycena alexandri]|uniref:Uncharacterized protein n=1 Tax=Mycena alexandri TaxID=1745969 RepID=A0AAD6S2Q4_9AGAR|nr:hypothetical protein C8F04DRAFT_1275912 [Mycena alexandri]